MNENKETIDEDITIMNEDVIPKEILHHFKKYKVEFMVSKFEQYLLNDLYQYDTENLQKLNRNVTNDLIQEIKDYVKQKRNIRYSAVGETRSGKSLSMLVIVNLYCKLTGFDFSNIEYIVCGNQVEYREKLKNAKFGDFFLIDENFFARSGIGANLEAQQLKDYNNTIAKQNIGNIFITPEEFLNVGAVLGFATYGRDSNNWLSRLLVYKFKNRHPYLVGFIVLDVGRLFMEHKCFLFKMIGGCNNTERKKLSEIPEDLIKYSTCIKNYDKKEVEKVENGCPFYKFCEHPLARYEKKKDSWIEGSMSGAIDNRTMERFKLALNLVLELIGEIDMDRQIIKYNCRSAKDMKNIVRLRVHKFTNTKLSIAEFDELLQIIISNSNLEFLIESLYVVKDEEIQNKFFSLEDSGEYLRSMYDEYVKNLPNEEK